MNNNLEQLEELANRECLLANPLEYDNPHRKIQVLRDFIHEYADMTRVAINETSLGFLDNLKLSIESLRNLNKESRCYSDRVILATENVSRLTIMPLLYPVIGGGYSMAADKDEIHVAIPKWKGVTPLFINNYVHEMLHVYHALMASDLKNAGLIDFDGFYDLPVESLTPYPRFAPNKRQLKKFERDVLHSIIRKINDEEFFNSGGRK